MPETLLLENSWHEQCCADCILCISQKLGMIVKKISVHLFHDENMQKRIGLGKFREPKHLEIWVGFKAAIAQAESG